MEDEVPGRSGRLQPMWRWAQDNEDVLGIRQGRWQPVKSLMQREESDFPQGLCYTKKNTVKVPIESPLCS